MEENQVTNLRPIHDEDIFPENTSKRLKIKRYLDSLPSGKIFHPDAVAKIADLPSVNSASKLLLRYENVKNVGRGMWIKL